MEGQWMPTLWGGWAADWEGHTIETALRPGTRMTASCLGSRHCSNFLGYLEAGDQAAQHMVRLHLADGHGDNIQTVQQSSGDYEVLDFKLHSDEEPSSGG